MTTSIFQEWFGTTAKPAHLLTILYEANGEFITHADLQISMRQSRAGLDFSLKQLRAAMEPGAIRCEIGRGYWLSVAGRADCDAALANAQKRGVAA